MKRECEVPVLTRILQEEAKRVCTPERMHEVWKGIDRKLDEREAKYGNKPVFRFKSSSGQAWKHVLVICVFLAVLLCAGVWIGHVFFIGPDVGTVVITDQYISLAKTPNDRAYVFPWYALFMLACFCVAVAVIIYQAALRAWRKHFIRRVICRAIVLGQEQEE